MAPGRWQGDPCRDQSLPTIANVPIAVGTTGSTICRECGGYTRPERERPSRMVSGHVLSSRRQCRPLAPGLGKPAIQNATMTIIDFAAARANAQKTHSGETTVAEDSDWFEPRQRELRRQGRPRMHTYYFRSSPLHLPKERYFSSVSFIPRRAAARTDHGRGQATGASPWTSIGTTQLKPRQLGPWR